MATKQKQELRVRELAATIVTGTFGSRRWKVAMRELDGLRKKLGDTQTKRICRAEADKYLVICRLVGKWNDNRTTESASA